MKAILDNFKKISDTEFRLKKTLQFARVSVDRDGKIKHVQYEDKQRIEKGDILTFEDKDYEIIDINTDNFDYLKVIVKPIIQEQDVPDKSDFIPRKMTPRMPKPEVHIPAKPTVSEEQIEKVKEKIEKSQPVVEIKQPEISKPIIPESKPEKRSLGKRLAGWISSKLSQYSNS
tara:strand:+ start:64 stop:582 length:519 start_codon:yes stop_codon:yes gene_type:complete